MLDTVVGGTRSSYKTRDAGQERAALAHLGARRAAKHGSAVINALQDGLIVVDERGVITDVNAVLCEMTGYNRAQLIGKRRLPFWARRDVSANATTLRTALAACDGARTDVTLWLTDRAGVRFPAHVAISPIRNSDQELVGHVSTLRRASEPSPAVDLVASAENGQELVASITAAAAAVREGGPSSTVLTRIALQAARVLGGDTAQIIRFDESGVTRRAVWTSQAVALLPITIPTDLFDQALRTARGVRWDADAVGEAPNAGTILVEPILVGDSAWGAIAVASAPTSDRPAAGAQVALRAFVDGVGLAIIGVDAQSVDATDRTRDSLTDLPNRQAFRRDLDREVSRAIRHGHDLAVVMLDVDHLRDINTDCGVECGDRVLSAVAAALRQVGRDSDVIARIGGDRFAWILPETDGHSAVTAAQRACARVSANAPDCSGPFDISAGVCDLRQAGETSRELVRQTLIALREAKQQGRGRIIRSSAVVDIAPSSADADRRSRDHGISAMRLLAKVIDERFGHRAGRSVDGAELAARLARHLGWSAPRATALYGAALVRDVGKILVHETSSERNIADRRALATHPAVGAEMVADFVTPEQAEWIAHHHDRYDGIDNPGGVRGEEIPEGARIIAIVDGWLERGGSAAGSARRSNLDAAADLRAEAGWAFWPTGVEQFLALMGGQQSPARSTARSSPTRSPALAGAIGAAAASRAGSSSPLDVI